MIGLLDEHDFAHPLPIFIGPAGNLIACPTDLADPRCVAWHGHPRHNTISLTGAAHTTALYRRLPAGWRPAPPGRWSDHFMWEQIFSVPGVRLATGRRATTIKPPANVRKEMSAAARGEELAAWWDRVHEPNFAAWWDEAVERAVRRTAVDAFRDVVELREALERERAGRSERTMREPSDIVRDHLVRVLDWEEAHVGLDTAVAGLPAEARGARPPGFDHSVWQLLEHIRIAQADLLDFCLNADYVHTKAWPDDYWPAAPEPPHAAAWDDSIAACTRSRERLQTLVRQVEDLTARVPTGKDGQTCLRTILVAADHVAYHVGQIVAVRRALGMWGEQAVVAATEQE
jgi:uncharacterized damage-inducible protein DinB